MTADDRGGRNKRTRSHANKQAGEKATSTEETPRKSESSRRQQGVSSCSPISESDPGSSGGRDDDDDDDDGDGDGQRTP